MNISNAMLNLSALQNNVQSQPKAQPTGMVDGILPFGLFMGEPVSPAEKSKQENPQATTGINSFESALYNFMNNMITQSVQNTQNNSLNNF
ncbi:hypothetical protein [Hydrogenobaculum acidophilum]